MLRIYSQLNQKTAIQFADYVLEKLPFQVQEIQTDNGLEFGSSFHYHLLDKGVGHRKRNGPSRVPFTVTTPSDSAERQDLVVIGGGAGGLAAARAGARQGGSVLLVQRGPLGGDCTFTGCVPSKALIEAAHRRQPFDRAIAAARGAVEVVAATEIDDVLRREGVEVLHGWATFLEPGVLDVDGTLIRPRKVVLATGARPSVSPIDGLTGID